MTNPVYPCLWFDTQAKEAATFYCSIFQHSFLTDETPTVVHFELDGVQFMGLNGGPQFRFNPSISLFVTCGTDEEVLYLWEKLSAGGDVLMPLDQYDWSTKYGWCADKFGLTWQIYMANTNDDTQKVVPLFLFSSNQFGNAESALNFYTSLFDHSEIKGIARYGEDTPEYKGMVLHSSFRMAGREFMAMDGPGDHKFEFNEAVSLVVECDTQEEIDFFWEAFTKEGEESMCGWCKDRFGVSWQIIPGILKELMSDTERGPRVMEAFLKMKKFDIGTLLKA